MTLPPVRVEVVTSAPKLINAVFVYGIQTKGRAEAWGWKNNHPVVYYWKARQRVYAEKESENVIPNRPTHS